MGRSSSCNRYLSGALKYLGDEAEKLGEEQSQHFDAKEWTLVPTDFSITPQQENGNDCGVFTTMFADFLTDDLPFNFSQENCALFRNKIYLNILNAENGEPLAYPEKTLQRYIIEDNVS